MEIIKSPDNKNVKRVMKLLEKSKARQKEDCFVCEGIREVSEVKAEDLDTLIMSESFFKDFKDYALKVSSKNADLNNIGNLMDKKETIVFSDSVFKKASDTVSPQGVMAIVKMRHVSLDELLSDDYKTDRGKNIIMILEDIQDPGNIGTIIRTGEAAGVKGFILSKGCVDIYNPKVVRSTMGSLLRSNIYVSDDLIKDMEIIKDKYVVYAAHLEGNKYYNEIDYPNNYGFIIGNEGRGISEELAKMAHEYVKIPMYGKSESLNAAIAAAILMYA